MPDVELLRLLGDRFGRDRLALVAESRKELHDKLAQTASGGKPVGMARGHKRGTDAPVVKDVLPAHELLPGARCELLPDLIIRWAHRRRATTIYSDQLGEIVAEPESGRTGEHRANGFAVLLDQNGSIDRLPPLSHNTHFPEFVQYLLNRAETR